MKTKQVAVGGLILRKDKKFLLTQRSLQEDFLPGAWELPGGGSEYGETPEQALRREIKEECGIDITVRVPLATAQYFMGDTQHIEIIFLCTMSKDDQSVQLSDEHDAFAWILIEELDTYPVDEFMRRILKDATADLDYWTGKYL